MPENNDDSDHIYSNIIEYGAYANIRQSSTPAVTDDVTVGGSGLLYVYVCLSVSFYSVCCVDSDGRHLLHLLRVRRSC